MRAPTFRSRGGAYPASLAFENGCSAAGCTGGSFWRVAAGPGAFLSIPGVFVADGFGRTVCSGSSTGSDERPAPRAARACALREARRDFRSGIGAEEMRGDFSCILRRRHLSWVLAMPFFDPCTQTGAHDTSGNVRAAGQDHLALDVPFALSSLCIFVNTRATDDEMP
ncbi:unnamed protein product [Mycena citricolor]|uniref:Uncharacterized protein n=1 Tax=Mycena citricolor TaxID=2018698 RepID=A0AAD2Q4K6_9AGAR|nr:unnamed protein product [Mycena citricolor]